jgi:phage baseplate assembly protein W
MSDPDFVKYLDDFEIVELSSQEDDVHQPEEILLSTKAHSSEIIRDVGTDLLQAEIREYVSSVIDRAVDNYTASQLNYHSPRDNTISKGDQEESIDSDTPILTPEEDAFLTSLLHLPEEPIEIILPDEGVTFDSSSCLSRDEECSSMTKGVKDNSQIVCLPKEHQPTSCVSDAEYITVSLDSHKVTVNLRRAMELGVVTHLEPLTSSDVDPEMDLKQQKLAEFGRKLLRKCI